MEKLTRLTVNAIYSYCTNWDVKEDTPYVGAVQIAAYVSSDPYEYLLFPDKIGKTKFTDEENVEHNYLGTILDNPSKLYGETYNNHHHMQNFKDIITSFIIQLCLVIHYIVIANNIEIYM